MRTTDNDRTPERGRVTPRKALPEDTSTGITEMVRAEISIMWDVDRLIANLPEDLQKEIHTFMQALHRYRASDRGEVAQQILLSPRVMRQKIQHFVEAIVSAGSESFAQEFYMAVRALWAEIAGNDQYLFEQIFPQSLPQASDDSIGNE